jgi:hypothetical protein
MNRQATAQAMDAAPQDRVREAVQRRRLNRSRRARAAASVR